MTTRTVLVTGSLGYLGSRLTGFLRTQGFRCLGYDTGFFQDCVLYPPVDAPTMLKDMRAFEPRHLEGVDAVVHLAEMSNDPVGTIPPERIYDPTRVYANELAQVCKATGVRFIFASSCSVYGIGSEGLLTEDSPTRPQTPYSLNKLQIEEDLVAMSDGVFCPIMLRFATVFGLSPRMRFDLVINMLVGMALTDHKIVLNSNGQAWRPHVHLDDVCQAILRCLDLPLVPGAPLILNIGDTGNNLQILEVAQMIASQLSGCTIEFLQTGGQRAGDDPMELIRDRKITDGVDTRTYRVSFERAKEVLPGFQCQWSVGYGIQRMIQELKDLRLTKGQFRHRRFYRLQTLEDLLAAGRLTDDVRWKEAPQPMTVLAGSG